MTNQISLFTVPVTFRGVAYDVEITPLMVGKMGVNPLPLMPDRIKQWNEAEKTHQLFSRKIVEMLEDVVSAGSDKILAVGSKDGFTFSDNTQTPHKTSDHWNKFIKCLDDPASLIAGRPELGDEEESVSGQETGLDARFRFSPHVYLSLRPNLQQSVQFDVFEKKCREYFCKKHNVRPSKEIRYDEFEKECLDTLLYRNPAQPKMDAEKELRALWDMQVNTEKARWSLAFDRIRKKVEEAAAALEEENSESSIEEL